MPNTNENISKTCTDASIPRAGLTKSGRMCVAIVYIIVPAENKRPRPVKEVLTEYSFEPHTERIRAMHKAVQGADRQKHPKLRKTILRGEPEPRRKLVRPKEAGALCNRMARSSTVSTFSLPEHAAAPRGIPSIAP
mmetsp:Transcript_3106/g.4495  ORF Transcript_3106/g.4495 Transcript_3106/m.4495 type:complete len:136 (+) Transcript_3106:71-478(+)